MNGGHTVSWTLTPADNTEFTTSFGTGDITLHNLNGLRFNVQAASGAGPTSPR